MKYQKKIQKAAHIFYAQCKSSKRRGHPAPEYSKNDLIVWLLSQKLYHKLHKKWRKSNYAPELAPSVDRFDDSVGYTFKNIHLTTWEYNNLKARSDQQRGFLKAGSGLRAVHQRNLNGVIIQSFISIAEASRVMEIQASGIIAACKGIQQTCGGYKWSYAEVLK